MSESVIKIDHLSKVYRLYEDPLDRLKEALHPFRKKYHRDFYALNDIDFEIVKGETVGIIGRNGAGKSTLLKILTGVLTPSQGAIRTSGKVLALLELGAGFNPELTGIENVYFNGAVLGASREEMDVKLDAILDFADIGDFIHQPVKSYSSGMYVRLAFAVIANMDADVIIVDEALSVGDAFFVQKCMRFLRKFLEQGTLVFVSHDTGAVLNLCDRAIWLHQGIVYKDGHPKEVTEAYLADLYEAQQGESSVAPQKKERLIDTTTDPRDMRLDFINTTPLRNDIELFSFCEDAASFGKGGAITLDVSLLDDSGRPLCWVVGGEIVHLNIQCRAEKDIFSPIVGFFVKDRLGQTLFGDNTFLTYQNSALQILSGEIFDSSFSFRMPILPIGEYSICVAIAEGTQQEHIQHQWVHDAVIFISHSTSASTGLVGIPMFSIGIKKGH